jgi:hypothetical protein
MLSAYVHLENKEVRMRTLQERLGEDKENAQSSALPVQGNICVPPFPSLVLYWH